MAYYVIDNFAAGLDTRRAAEVAPVGSLRVLSNAFVNQGGEIEKAKAFTKDTALTDYGQTVAYKDRITGPHEVPGYPEAVFFRHYNDSLPSTGWTAGSGSVAMKYTTGAGSQVRNFWAMKSTQALTNFGALLHSASYSQFGTTGYAVDQFLNTSDGEWTRNHINTTFTEDEPTAEATVTANADRAFQMTLAQKGYVANVDTLHASAVGDPADMAGTGFGSLLFSQNGQPIGKAIALGDYFGQLVIFGVRGVQFYSVDPDFALVQYLRTIPAFPFAPRSIEGYGSGDLMFLSRSGVRSLRARDSSNLAAVDDVGSAIDSLIRDEIEYDADDTDRVFTLASTPVPLADHAVVAQSVVHPLTGQFWLFLKDKAYVFSRHTGSKVFAWSTVPLPIPAADNESELNGEIKSRWCADVCRVGQTLVMRNFANEVYVYGGENDTTYDGTAAIAQLPFMDMGSPGTNKYFTGIDVVSEGEWDVEISTNPMNEGQEDDWVKVAEIRGRNRTQERIQIAAQGAQIAVRLTSTSQYAARISQIIVTYKGGSEK